MVGGGEALEGDAVDAATQGLREAWDEEAPEDEWVRHTGDPVIQRATRLDHAERHLPQHIRDGMPYLGC